MISEQTVINIVYFLIHDLLSSAIYYVFMFLMLTPKYNKAMLMIILTLLCTVLEYICNGGDSGTLQFLSYMLVIIVPALFVFKEKKKICFFAVSIILIDTLILDTLYSACMLKIFGFYPTKVIPYTWTAVWAVLGFIVIYLPQMALIIYLWRRKIKKYNTKSTSFFILFPIGQAFFIVACTYPTWQFGSTFEVFDNPFMIIGFVVSVVSDILMFIALRDNNNLESAKARAETAEREIEQQAQYYKELSEKMSEITEYRKDINALVSVTESLLTESSSQSSREFIREMKQKAEAMRMPEYSAAENGEGSR